MWCSFCAALNPHASSTCETEQCSQSPNIRCAADGTSVSITCVAQSQNTDEDLHPQARQWCLRLGMTTAGFEQWAKLHVNPLVAACHFIGSLAALHLTVLWVLIGMANFRALYMYVSRIPLWIYFGYGVLFDVVAWRYGPGVVDHKLYPALLSLSTSLLLPSVILGYLGPLEAVPFHNRFYYICLSSVGVFCTTQSMTAGGSKGDHPLEPRTSILWPFVRGTVRAVQLVDAFTDLAVIKTLMEQARPNAAQFNFPSGPYCCTSELI